MRRHDKTVMLVSQTAASGLQQASHASTLLLEKHRFFKQICGRGLQQALPEAADRAGKKGERARGGLHGGSGRCRSGSNAQARKHADGRCYVARPVPLRDEGIMGAPSDLDREVGR